MAGNRFYAEIVTVGTVSLYDVNANPNGVLSAARGSLAMRRTAGFVNLYQNQDGAVLWATLLDHLVERIATQNTPLGAVCAITAASEFNLALATTASGRYDASGIAVAAVAAGDTGLFYTGAGQLVPILFGVAPLAASNGSRVFLSQTNQGQATLTSPSASGQRVVRLGILVGANGITLTPDCLFTPEYVAAIA